jgi:O-antigen ligase
VLAVPLGALAALAGAYPSSTFPLLLAAGAAFLMTSPRDMAVGPARALDAALLLFLAGIVIQMLPLPVRMVDLVSPHAEMLRAIFAIGAPETTRTLSTDTARTRDGLASAASALMVFWAAREAFARGGIRVTIRTLAFAAAIAALVGMAQRVTSPTLLLWTWTPIDPGAQPYGPFVNRDHFATWLLMASAVTLGYVATHVRSHRLLDQSSLRLLVRDVLSDGTGLLLLGCAGATIAALVAAVSRGAIVGAIFAIAAAATLARKRRARGRGFTVTMVVVIGMLAWAMIANLGGLVSRLQTGGLSRTTIWRETLPIVHDFPLAGTGLGTYAETMLVYQQSTSQRLFNQAHSEYLQLAAEGGLLLVLPALVAAICWWRLALRYLHSDRRELLWVRVGAAAGIVGAAVQSIWDSPLRLPANAMLLALLAAIVVHERRDADAISDSVHAA